MRNLVEVWTDGSCNWKLKLGGVGVYIPSLQVEFNRGYKDTTISRMELKAICLALSFINDVDCKVKLYSDSEYCVNIINKQWYIGWEERMFLGVKNEDLIKELLCQYRRFKYIEFIHVRGHQGVLGNEIVDLLANYKNFTEYEFD